MTRPATRAEIAYLAERVMLAFRAVQAAKGARLGATIIKRREGKWHVAVAKLEAAQASRSRAA
jgi:hypothetical protein